MLFDILLEVGERQLVPVLERAVALGELLHRVVGEVDQRVRGVLQLVLLARRPQVALPTESLGALLEEEDFVLVGDQDPDADVELPPVDQHGSLHVLLNDETQLLWTSRCDSALNLGGILERGPKQRRVVVIGFSFECVLFENLLELPEGGEDVDASTSVLVGGLQNPNVRADKVAHGHDHLGGVVLGET